MGFFISFLTFHYSFKKEKLLQEIEGNGIILKTAVGDGKLMQSPTAVFRIITCNLIESLPMQQKTLELKELITLAKDFILSEYPQNQKLITDPETYRYFLSLAQKNISPKSISAKSISKEPKPITANYTPQESKIALSPLPLPKSTQPSSPSDSQPKVKAKSLPLPLLKKTAVAPPSTLKKDQERFALQPPDPIAAPSFAEMEKLVAEKLPYLKIVKAIPDDKEAHQIANQWKSRSLQNDTSAIVLLSFGSTTQEMTFLENVKKALAIYQIPCVMIKESSQEDFSAVRLAIGSKEATDEFAKTGATCEIFNIAKCLVCSQEKAALWQKILQV